MRRHTMPVFLALAFALGLSLPLLAQGLAGQAATVGMETPAKVGSAVLIKEAKAWDGRTVTFEGEAIGDPMIRGTNAWINVLDRDAAIGIWMTADAARTVHHFGAYRMTGDSLRITGVFHRACPEHGGDLDVHATAVELVAEGRARAHQVDRPYLFLLIPAFAAAAALLAAWRRREARLGWRGK